MDGTLLVYVIELVMLVSIPSIYKDMEHDQLTWIVVILIVIVIIVIIIKVYISFGTQRTENESEYRTNKEI